MLFFGVGKLLVPKAQAQVVWNEKKSPTTADSSIDWKLITEEKEHSTDQKRWEIVPKSQFGNQPPSSVVWEVLDTINENSAPTSESKLKTEFTPPSSFEEVEELFRNIPIEPSDYTPLLNLSYSVPTAEILNKEYWHLSASTISSFIYEDGTGNQNYAIRLDFGLSNTLQISGFYTQTDDPLNAQITGLQVRPANFWEVYGAAARWQITKNEKFTLALDSSLETWTVGSGGSNSVAKNQSDTSSPNIFNDSGRRVETQNLIGSISLPLTWSKNKEWQFTFSPGVSFLPPSQGKEQGGAGKFYGTNAYLSGGILWHPSHQLGISASIAQPIGNSTNSFDKNLNFSSDPVISAGLNWSLNPRIILQGQITNGFGATPSTGILTLPSDNRLGYSINFVFNADAPDTPQPPLTSRQHSLSLGGLTVNTALVPPDTSILTKGSTDTKGNFEKSFGFSISNVFQLDFSQSRLNNIPQDSIQAITYANDGIVNWRGSGKAILTSPLRGAPLWSALRISFGRNMDNVKENWKGYLFAETPFTWEASSNMALSINPKVAWTGVGTLLGLGISANIQLAPRLELIPEANIILSSPKESNCTLGLRWNVTDNIAIETYGSTASSLMDIGQLLNTDEIHMGSRLTIKL